MFRRTMCFVNCHFAAHLEAVKSRNADFDHVYRTMVFSRPSNLLNAAAGMVPYLFLSCFPGQGIYGLFILFVCHWSLMQLESHLLFKCFAV